jgi:hypothetical protein
MPKLLKQGQHRGKPDPKFYRSKSVVMGPRRTQLDQERYSKLRNQSNKEIRRLRLAGGHLIWL